MQALDFWQVHGVMFLIFMLFFPRLTMLFGTTVLSRYQGAEFCLTLIGWLIAPRITCAFIASFLYWEHNPVLVIGAWILALSGEGVEKTGIVKSKSK